MKKVLIAVTVIVCVALTAVGIYMYAKNTKYTTDYTVNDTLSDGEGKTARVILLAGQSNAAGCSRDDYLKNNVSEGKYAEYENGYDNVYINYFASGTNQSCGFVKCGARQGEAGGFFGPELGLAEMLHAMYPDETFFIIKYGWGATSLYDQWLSPSSFGVTRPLYKEFVGYVHTSMQYLISKNYDVKIEGMCWMQGESDAFSVENGNKYKTRLNNFIEDLRLEFSKYSSNDGIAFIDAYIADNPDLWIYCELVNESKRAVAEMSNLNVVIDTNAEGLTCTEEPSDEPDIAHYDSLSQIKLGNLFAIEVSKFFD